MAISFDLSERHYIMAANTHVYEQPTIPHYLDRTLEYHDIIYLIRGKWLFTENETDYPLEPGDVLLLNAGYHHYTRLPCEKGTRTICIHVTKSETDSAGAAEAVTLPSLIHASRFPVIKELFEEIINEFWSEKPLKKQRSSILFDDLIIRLSDICTETYPGIPDLCSRIMDMINREPSKNIRLAELSSQFNVSPKAINAAMHKAVGMSFPKYQLKRKLEMAANYLAVEPDIRLAEVAAMFGFFDEFHMSHAFKAHFGMSPAAYKQKIAQG